MPNASYAKQVGLQRTPPQLLKKIRAGYAGGITWTDMQIGKVLDALEATGKAKDTLVMYWADHGWALGEQAMFCKVSCCSRGKSPSFLDAVSLTPALCVMRPDGKLRAAN